MLTKTRLLAFLLAAILLLAGCSQPPEDTETTTVPTTSTAATEPPVTIDEDGFMEARQSVDGQENLWYVPCKAIKDMVGAQMYQYRSCLLFVNTQAGQDGSFQTNLLMLSMEDGSVAARTQLQTGSTVTLQFGGEGGIGICAPSAGKVYILDELLNTTQVYDFEKTEAVCYLDSDLATLFFVDPAGTVAFRPLTADRKTVLLANAQELMPIGTCGDVVYVSYRVPGENARKTSVVDMLSRSIDPMIPELHATGIQSQSNSILAENASAPGKYDLVFLDNLYRFNWEAGNVCLLRGNQLLLTDLSSRTMRLCAADGQYVSSFRLPEDTDCTQNAQVVWSGYHDGYFLLDAHSQNRCRLFFWNDTIPTQGDALTVNLVGSALPEPPTMEELSRKAKELSDTYGLTILIGEECQLRYTHYDADILTDPTQIGYALDTLEKALAAYPAGFFRQLRYGDIKRTQIEITGSIFGNDAVSSVEHADGFVQSLSDHNLMVLCGKDLTKLTVFHEFSHIIDRYLAWDAQTREGALFSEAGWLSYQPQGFEYLHAFTYEDLSEQMQQHLDSGYFLSAYCMVSPTEDRAVTLANAMVMNTYDYQNNPAALEKLRYYCACIRDCFDTEGWPNVTAWEEMLQYK